MSSTLYLTILACFILTSNSRQEEEEEEQQQQIDSDNQPSGSNVRNKVVDENWWKHFNQLFHEDLNNLNSPLKLVKELERLHAESFQASSSELKDKGMKVFELIKLSHVFPASCTGSMFSNLDSLAKEYSVQEGYSATISQYISYFRNQFWLICQRSFVEGQRPSVGLVYEDEVEAIAMVDHILTALNGGQFHGSNLRPDLEIDSQVLLRGIIDYVQAKLGDDLSVVDKSRIDELFVDKISPVCGSVQYRFIGKAKMEEIIDRREDLRRRLDSRSIKWLIAKKICNDILAKLLFFRDEVSKQRVPLSV